MNIRKYIMDNIDDDIVARKLLIEIQLMQDRVTEREWALEDQLLRERVESLEWAQ